MSIRYRKVQNKCYGIKCKSGVKKEDFGANNITGYRIIYSPEIGFTPTGVNAKGHRTDFYTKAMFQGAKAEELGAYNLFLIRF